MQFHCINALNHQYAGRKPGAPRSGVSLPATQSQFRCHTEIDSNANPRFLADDLFSLYPDMFGYKLKHLEDASPVCCQFGPCHNLQIVGEFLKSL